ncbi:hypothetical protein LTS10_009234 [Elasticomyces elasticus]|nr:hypothetical protein LTS10_009234 [Elasticomyces elasticus]
MLGHEAAVLAQADEDDADEVDAAELDVDEISADEVDTDEVDSEDVVSDEVDASDVTSDEVDEVVKEDIDDDDVDATDSLVELLEVLLDGRETVEKVLEVDSVAVEEVVLRATEAVVVFADRVDALMGAKLEYPSSVLVYVITSVAV